MNGLPAKLTGGRAVENQQGRAGYMGVATRCQAMLSRYRREFTLKGAPAAETEVAKSGRRGLPFDKLRMNKLTMREPGFWQIITREQSPSL
jgi:hypothetical protein